MNHSTLDIAEHMLASGKHYSAALLGKELGITAQAASGKLYNIRTAQRYQCEITTLPNRQVKVLGINGRSRTRAQLVNAFLKGLAGRGAE